MLNKQWCFWFAVASLLLSISHGWVTGYRYVNDVGGWPASAVCCGMWLVSYLIWVWATKAVAKAEANH